MPNQVFVNHTVPWASTVSPEFLQAAHMLAQAFAKHPAPPLPRAHDLAGWQNTRAHLNAVLEWPTAMALKAHADIDVSDARLGGVPVVWFRPKAVAASKAVFVYLHGGGYVMGTARNSVAGPLAIARLSGQPVVSVDYTLAPDARWRQVTDEVLAVFDALAAQGVAAGHTALFGDSAGGGLAAGSVLKMRDQGRPMPAALALWSPWSDITDIGDSFLTLAHAEFLQHGDMSQAALAYAEQADHLDPMVSPVYGDFSRGFPPTLVQCGTREIFLSHAVRLYTALDSAGIPVQLDLYEGMPHVHQVLAPESPEARRAFRKTADFMRAHVPA